MELMPMPPIISLISCFHAVMMNQSFHTDIGVEPFNQLGPLGSNAPVAFALMAAAAEMAAQCEQGGGGDIYRIRSQRDCFDDIGARPDTSADHQADTVVCLRPADAIDAGKRQLNRDANIVPYAGGEPHQFRRESRRSQ